LFVDWATCVDGFWASPDQAMGLQGMRRIRIDVNQHDVLDLYCIDLGSGVQPADSRVYHRFSNHHGVQRLPARTPCTRLAQTAAALGYCDQEEHGSCDSCVHPPASPS
jgi:hypothetical protein